MCSASQLEGSIKHFPLFLLYHTAVKKDLKNTTQVHATAVEAKLCSTILIHVPLGELENSLVPIKREKLSSSKKGVSYLHCNIIFGQKGFAKCNFLTQSCNREIIKRIL